MLKTEQQAIVEALTALKYSVEFKILCLEKNTLVHTHVTSYRSLSNTYRR